MKRGRGLISLFFVSWRVVGPSSGEAAGSPAWLGSRALGLGRGVKWRPLFAFCRLCARSPHPLLILLFKALRRGRQRVSQYSEKGEDLKTKKEVYHNKWISSPFSLSRSLSHFKIRGWVGAIVNATKRIASPQFQT